MWKNVVKVLRSDFFKNALKNGDYEVSNCQKLNTVEILSQDDLENLINSHINSTFAIAIMDNITIAENTLPKWSYGYLAINGDASLNLVGLNGDHITAYYNAVLADSQPWTIKTVPDLAKKANMVELKSGSKDANLIVSNAGLYCVVVRSSSGSGVLTTHLLSIENISQDARSSADINNTYVKYDGSTGALSVTGGETGEIESFITLMYYDF